MSSSSTKSRPEPPRSKPRRTFSLSGCPSFPLCKFLSPSFLLLMHSLLADFWRNRGEQQ
ncbi:putative cytochrome P450 superfamily protein isoform X4 [Iris pallida]|uniref:Cytochrome P450 superfamily protein isoform X4 n=1 Tax=Iris pallida TaxID=29817 RepID=A0AAX6IK01_IRIPA|nr:putative cytochrome P450 superfamily protein isoform X4 [Iris pallida]